MIIDKPYIPKAVKDLMADLDIARDQRHSCRRYFTGHHTLCVGSCRHQRIAGFVKILQDFRVSQNIVYPFQIVCFPVVCKILPSSD